MASSLPNRALQTHFWQIVLFVSVLQSPVLVCQPSRGIFFLSPFDSHVKQQQFHHPDYAGDKSRRPNTELSGARANKKEEAKNRWFARPLQRFVSHGFYCISYEFLG